MTQPIRRLAPSAVMLLAAILLGACSSATPGPTSEASASAPAASASASASATASASASASASAEPGPSATGVDSGGAVGGNPGNGATPGPIAPVGPGQSPGSLPGPSPMEVQPVAGLLNIHDVHANAIQADASNGHLVAKVEWWSGPPPCSQLAEVSVVRSGDTFTLTVREGAAQLGVACPALAMYKATTVDLGPVPPGTYRVGAIGVDAPVVVRYPG